MNLEKRMKSLEDFYNTMSEEDKTYLSERGFDVKKGLPKQGDNINRPYLVLSSDFPFELKYSDRGSLMSGIIDPTKHSEDSLAGLIEETTLKLKNRQNLMDSYPNPVSQPILLYINNPNWQPVIDILTERYNK